MYIKISVNFFVLVFKNHKMLLFITLFHLICFFKKGGKFLKKLWCCICRGKFIINSVDDETWPPDVSSISPLSFALMKG